MSSIRNIFAGVFVLAFVAVGSGLALPTSADAATLPATSACVADATTTSTPVASAYYLFESNGDVASCGGAPLHGWEKRVGIKNPIVTGAVTTGNAGYWLIAAKGQVYVFGNARSYGSPVHVHLPAAIVGFAPTPDDKGYWLISAKGNLFHYGDAGFYGSSVHDQKDGAVVSILTTPDGKGYWIVNADGTVHNYGDASPLGSLTHRRPVVIAAAATPDGHGLLLLTKDGGVHNLGTSTFYGSLVHRRLPRPLTSIVATPQGSGYLVANAAGSIFTFGGASFAGSLAATPPQRPTRVVAIEEAMPTQALLTSVSVAPSALVPLGDFGYDISNFQCASPGSSLASSSLPPTSSFSVIEAAGWLDGANNSCLGAEATWATTAAGPNGAHYSLYLFVNSPDQSAAANTLDANGPAGQCATLLASAQPACLAYNYGYEGAQASANYATSVGVSSPLWWLDVEGTNLSKTEFSSFSAGQYWSSSTSLNDETIQGAIDGLRAMGTTVGIYSSSVQFPTIAGSFVPSGSQIPLWIAGAPYTNPPYSESGLAVPSVLSGWCLGTSGYTGETGTDLFAGGVPWILQETPGSEPSPYGIDPDYAC
jgi:hypothetical protein